MTNSILNNETPEQTIERINKLIDERRCTDKMPIELMVDGIQLLSSDERQEYHNAKMAYQEASKGDKAAEAKARNVARIAERNANKKITLKSDESPVVVTTITEVTTNLSQQSGSSDKVYNVTLKPQDDGFAVVAYSGRRGQVLKLQPKTKEPVSLEEATKIFDKLVKSKIKSGYSDSNAEGVEFVQSENGSEKSGVDCLLLNPIEKVKAKSLIEDDNHIMQEKFDGERRLIEMKLDSTITGINRKGLYVSSLPQGIVNDVKTVNAESCVIDGEQVGDTLYVFDILELDGKDLKGKSTMMRLSILKDVFVHLDWSGSVILCYTAYTTMEKRALYSKIEAENGEGVVFKNKHTPYLGGRPSSMGNYLKFKFYKECSVIVMSQNQQRSVAIGVYDETGALVPVGNVTIPVNQEVYEVGTILEIRYLYAYLGGSLFQPVCKFSRDDIQKSDCVIGQLVYKAEVKAA
jgi:bifunctional non-homologous end joining protein LigD